MKSELKDFMSFIDNSGSRFTASEEIVKRLDKAGFARIDERDAFTLKAGGKYYLVRDNTATIAFIMGTKAPAEAGFALACSHIDSPCLRLKPLSEKIDKGVTKIGVEVYGGPILHTWIDRELSISGQVILKQNGKYSTVNVDLKKPMAIIPNAAIHMNREVNNGFKYSAQTHLQAFLSTSATEGKSTLKALLADHLKVSTDEIHQMELYLYDPSPAALIGHDQDMLASGRLDNLAMTHAILSAITQATPAEHTSLAAFYDHEEIGSTSPQGADSSLLYEVLERISASSREDFYRALKRSYLISADMAHAYHPSFAEKYDSDYSPLMNKGIVLKRNASLKYASTAQNSIRFMQICDELGLPLQEFLVRSDVPCGSTVGPIVSASLGVPTIDIGNPMWAMHSMRETCGTKDHLDLIKALTHYYSKTYK